MGPLLANATDAASSGLCLIPCALVLATAVWWRRSVEPLLLGAVAAFGLSSGAGFADAFLDSLLATLATPEVVWIVLVCGLFGSLVQVLAITGAADAFGMLLSRVGRGPRGVLTTTWLLGLVIFVDDYLNALTVGSTMRRLADRHGVPRAMLAYVVDSTAAPVCVLVPLSTWALFTAGLLEETGLAGSTDGMSAYVAATPYIVYAWAALALAVAVALGVVPAIGPMRRAVAASNEPAHVVPESPGSAPEASRADASLGTLERPVLRAIACLGALASLVGVTLLLGADDDNRVLKAVFVALATAVVLGGVASRRSPRALADATLEGFAKMTPALVIIVLSFVLKEGNDQLGLTDYVISVFAPAMSPTLMPAIVFVSLSIVTFATGSFWGAFAVTLPVVGPLAAELGVPAPLAIGAVVSAGAFGSHACFYGDATVLSAAACGVDTLEHAVTQAPYALIAAAVSVVAFLLLGLTL